jgi:hypothetical protein
MSNYRFPGALDNFRAAERRPEQIPDVFDAIDALQKKVGANASADTASLDYRVAHGGGGGGGGSSLPIADPTGVQVLSGQPNPLTGADDLMLLEFPGIIAGQGVGPIYLAVKQVGDAFPRLLFFSDQAGGILLSDGTFDAWNTSTAGKVGGYWTAQALAFFGEGQIEAEGGDLHLDASSGHVVQVGSDLTFQSPAAQGVILYDRTLGGAYRLKVDNGVLGVEQVT